MKSPSALFLLAGLIMGFTIAWIVKPHSKSSIHELVGILNEQQLSQYQESLKIQTATLLESIN